MNSFRTEIQLIDYCLGIVKELKLSKEQRIVLENSLNSVKDRLQAEDNL